MSVSVEKLTDADSLLSEWRTLSSQVVGGSIFLSTEWMTAWLQGTSVGSTLWLVRAVADDSPILLGVIGVKKAEPLHLLAPTTAHLHEFGVAQSDAICVEHNDFLMLPEAYGLREEALAAVLDAIGAIDELVLRNACSELAAAAERLAASRGLTLRKLQVHPTFAIDFNRIKSAGDEYLATRSSSLRTQLRRSLRLYGERGPVRVDVAKTDSDRSTAWATLRALHRDGWLRRGHPGVFENASFVQFHERLARSAPQCVELVLIRAGEEVVGCLYNLVHGKRAFNYQSGFKFENDNQLKPGMVAHALTAQHYLERGYSSYELLAGESQYKRRLSEESETLTTLVLETKRGLRAQVRSALRSLRRKRSHALGTHRT